MQEANPDMRKLAELPILRFIFTKEYHTGTTMKLFLGSAMLLHQAVGFNLLQRSPRQIFLTGATGMVGSRIARDLLDSDPSLQLGCLVRANDKEDATKRLERAMKEFGYDCDHSRLDAIPGDITAEQLGMTHDSYGFWKNADAVVHCAADIGLSKSKLSTNVVGVRNVIDLAAEGDRMSSLHFMSSVASCIYSKDPSVPEKQGLPSCTVFPGGYGQTKYEAEALVDDETRRQGLKSIVYRAPFILSRSRSQEMAVPDIFFRLSLLSGVIPRCNGYIPLFTLEGVSQAVTQAVLHGDRYVEDGDTKTLHLFDTNQPLWKQQLATIRNASPDMFGNLEEVDFDEFQERAQSIARLYPSTKFLGSRGVLAVLKGVFCRTRVPLLETSQTQSFLTRCGVDLSSHNVGLDDLAASASFARAALIKQVGEIDL